MVQTGVPQETGWFSYLQVGSLATEISGGNIVLTGSIVPTGGIATPTYNVTGSVVAQNAIVTGSINLPLININSFTDSQAVVMVGPLASAIISGGMWVTGSAASGTTPAYVSVPGIASAGWPLGIALANCASGAAPRILTRGLYKGLIAEASLNAGVEFSAGAGNALNCAKAAGAGTNRGVVLMGAGSEGTISVYLW